MSLSDITVVERSQSPRGAMCGRLLSDFGASVHLIEEPDGHPLRSLTGDAETDEHIFKMYCVNKSGVHTDGQYSKFEDLIKTADVFIIDTPNPQDKYSESTLRDINPDITYCSITPYGRTGPLAEKDGDNMTTQAMSGISHTTGFEGGKPALTAAHIGATFASLVGLGSIIYSLSDEDGEDSIDISVQDALLPLNRTFLGKYFGTGQQIDRSGNQHPLVAPWNAFEAEDGWVFLIAYTNRDWKRLLDLLGRQDLDGDPRFSSMAKRKANVDEINDIIEQWVSKRSVSDILELADDHGVVATEIKDVQQAFTHPNLDHRQMTTDLDGDLVVRPPLSLEQSIDSEAYQTSALNHEAGGNE